MGHEGLCIFPRDMWSKLKQIMREKERMREIERERKREKGIGGNRRWREGHSCYQPMVDREISV